MILEMLIDDNLNLLNPVTVMTVLMLILVVPAFIILNYYVFLSEKKQKQRVIACLALFFTTPLNNILILELFGFNLKSNTHAYVDTFVYIFPLLFFIIISSYIYSKIIEEDYSKSLFMYLLQTVTVLYPIVIFMCVDSNPEQIEVGKILVLLFLIAYITYEYIFIAKKVKLTHKSASREVWYRLTLGLALYFLTAIIVYMGLVLEKTLSSELALIAALVTIVLLLVLHNFLNMMFSFVYQQMTMVNIVEERIEAEKSKVLAEEENRAKTDFLATMSHEIRTPINAICGMSELLNLNNLTPLEREYVNTIKISSANLLNIINDILDVSKITAGKMELVPVEYSLNDLVNEIKSIINARIGSKDIAFIINLDPHIPKLLYGDEIRVKQILLNLLSNAAKFTNVGKIELKVHYECIDEDTIRLYFEVSDTGIGIREKDKEKLFGAFNRLDITKNRNIEGTGLGITITRRLANMMGGGITVESEYGKGSTFKTNIEQVVADGAPCAVVAGKENYKVYIFEPNSYYRASLLQIFEQLKIDAEVLTDLYSIEKTASKKGKKYLFFDYTSGIGIIKVLKNKIDGINLVGMAGVSVYVDDIVSDKIKYIYKPVATYSITEFFTDEEISTTKGERGERRHLVAEETKVLLVDDNLVNLKVAEGLMKPYKLQVTSVLSGQEAIDLIASGKEYDIVFMDHMMPEMDGIEAVKRIRELNSEYAKKVPIIALTATAMKGMDKMFMEKGMNDFLAKPIDIKKLEILLKKWVSKEKQRYDKVEKITNTFEKSLIKQFKAIKGLNVYNGLNMCLNNPQAYYEILKVFATTSPTSVINIERSYESKNYKDYITEVHGAKSSAKNIGADELSELAKSIELAGKAGNIAFVEEKHQLFLKDYIDMINEISIICEKNKKEATMEINAEHLQSVVERAIKAAEDMDVKAATAIIEELNQYAYHTVEVNRLLEEAKEYIYGFDFFEAIVAFEQVLKLIKEE